MKTIDVPGYEQVETASQVIFDHLTKAIGRVPNLYAVMGYSANTLKGFMDFEAQVGKGAFSPKEREAISLVVSEVNHCNYCLAAHTLQATMKGFTPDETLGFRKGIATDPKLHATLQLAKSIAEQKGDADPALVAQFFDQGYTEAALIDLTALVVIRTFTNYVYALSKVPVDFPAAAALA
jgi:AhpD family alkylhydroperoxidase